jgi:bacteriocin biosynthesis cyclodehydratase domain-containing protein
MNENALFYPALDAAAGVIPLPHGRVQIRTPGSRLTIGKQAQLALELVRLCDGTRSFADIIASLTERGYSGEQSLELYKLLERRAVLIPEAPRNCEDVLLTHAMHFARRWLEGSALPEPGERSVQVCGTGHLADAVRSDLARLHIPFAGQFDPRASNVALIIACSDFENHVAFRERNRAAVAAGRPIFFACISEAAVRFGPLVVPRESACFECFHHRLRANLTFREEFDAFLAHNAFQDESGVDSRAGIYARLGSAFICAQVVQFLLGCTQHCVVDRLIEVSPITVDMVSSRVLKLPRCEVCGRTEEFAPPAARDWI